MNRNTKNLLLCTVMIGGISFLPIKTHNFKIHAVTTQTNTPLSEKQITWLNIQNKLNLLKQKNDTDATNWVTFINFVIEHRHGYKSVDKNIIPRNTLNETFDYICDAQGTISIKKIDNVIIKGAFGEVNLTLPPQLQANQISDENLKNLIHDLAVKMRMLDDLNTQEGFKIANAIQWVIDHKDTFASDLNLQPLSVKDFKLQPNNEGKLTWNDINKLLDANLLKFNLIIPPSSSVNNVQQKLGFGIDEKIFEWRKLFEIANIDKYQLSKELDANIITELTRVQNKRNLVDIIIKVLSTFNDKTWANKLQNAGNDENLIEAALRAAGLELMGKFPLTTQFILDRLIGTPQNKGWDGIRNDALALPQIINVPIDYNIPSPAPIPPSTQNNSTSAKPIDTSQNNLGPTKSLLPMQNKPSDLASQNNLIPTTNLSKSSPLDSKTLNEPKLITLPFNNLASSNTNLPETSGNINSSNKEIDTTKNFNVKGVSKSLNTFFIYLYSSLLALSSIMLLILKKIKIK